MIENSQPPGSTPALPAGDSATWRFAGMVAGSLFSPGQTLREIGQREAILPAILLVLLIASVTAAGQLAGLPAGAGQTPGMDASGLVAVQAMGILWNIVWTPVIWTIAAALLYGVAYLLGGRGQFQSLWAATGFALTPHFLVAPLAPLSEVAALVGPGWQLVAFLGTIPIYIAALIWSLVLFSIAVRETMSLSGGRAFGAVAILIGALVLLAALAFCVLLLVIVGAFATFA